jgi:tetratricopeptide (TPR) repeat protein
MPARPHPPNQALHDLGVIADDSPAGETPSRERVHELRERYGLLDQDIARATDATPRTVARWRTSTSPRRLSRFDAKLDALFELIDEVEPLVGGDPHAVRTLLTKRNRKLDGRRPIDLLGDGDYHRIRQAFNLTATDSLPGEYDPVEETIAEQNARVAGLTHELGPDAPKTLSARSNLASWLGRVGRIPDAIAQLERLVDDYARVMGADAPVTLSARSDLANWLAQAGRFEEAIAALEALLVDRTRVLGSNTPEVRDTRADLTAVFVRSGREEEAVAGLAKVIPIKGKLGKTSRTADKAASSSAPRPRSVSRS